MDRRVGTDSRRIAPGIHPALVAVPALAGAALTALGGDEEPLWPLAVLALVAFPLAAAAARSGGGERPGATVVTAISAGLLIGMLVRLAIAAPGWETTPGGTCDAAAEGVQQVVLWGGTLIFALAALPLVAALVRLAGRDDPGGPLTIYPVAVAMSGLALIGASFATSCG